MDETTTAGTMLTNLVPGETWTISVSNVGLTTSVGSYALSIGQFLLFSSSVSVISLIELEHQGKNFCTDRCP